jgi:prolyl oligopeptidase
MSAHSARAPETRVEAVVERLHGVDIVDPYRWLEDGAAPEVRAWSAAQAAHTQAWLATWPGRAALRARLERLLSIGMVSAPLLRGEHCFFLRRQGAEQQPRLYLRLGPDGPERELLDPAGLAPDGTAALDWHHPSPDGRLLAYGVSEGGSEKSTLHLLEVATRQALPDVIPFTRACSLAWWPDACGFFYTRYPEPGSVPAGEEVYHRQVFRHVLGTDWRADTHVFGAGRAANDWPSVLLAPNGRWLVVVVERGWSANDVYICDLARGLDFVPVAEGLEALTNVIVRDDRLLLHTNLGAPRYRLAALPLAPEGLPPQLGPDAWHQVLPEGADVLESVQAIGPWLLTAHLERASSRVAVHTPGATAPVSVALPGLGSVGAIEGAWDGHEAYLEFSSFTTPPSVLRLDLREANPGNPTPCDVWQRAQADVRPEDYTVELEHCRSRDGTSVSFFVVHRRDRRSDGSGPALLNGYGGFNVSLSPAFSRNLLAFLDQGGLYAVAHLRGGAEYGEDWHRAGMLARKQNTFDDFIAVAEHLVAVGHVAPRRLAIEGGSNGGLLVGAALTQRPELFRAAVCQVPLLDMLRYHRFRIARLWIPEYGCADDPEAFEWLRAYSPYHHVRAGVAYPAVLLTAGDEDSRVDALHARKMAARLQAASSSGQPVLLRLELRAGHGQGKPLHKLVDEWTDVWTFLFERLEVPAPA